MTGMEIYLLGKNSSAARACVPMNFEHTAPRISRSDRWIAEFWYYSSNIVDTAIYEPQYYMAFELPGGHPVEMRLIKEKSVCIGGAPELLAAEFYEKQNQYLEKCAELISRDTPSDADIKDLENMWFSTLPKALRKELSSKAGVYAALRKVSEDEEKCEKEYLPDNLMSYWKNEMARAIRKGDSEEAKRAQKEMDKAINAEKNL